MENKRNYPAGPSSDGAKKKKGPTTEEDDLIEEAMDDFDADAAMQPPEECEDAELGEAGRNWERPAVQPFDPKTTAIGQAYLASSCIFCMLRHILVDLNLNPPVQFSSRWRLTISSPRGTKSWTRIQVKRRSRLCACMA